MATCNYIYEMEALKMNTLDRLRKLVNEEFDEIDGEINCNSKLMEDLHLDSLDMYEMIVEVEDLFDISISEEKLDQIYTVGDVVEIIDRERTRAKESKEDESIDV